MDKIQVLKMIVIVLIQVILSETAQTSNLTRSLCVVPSC